MSEKENKMLDLVYVTNECMRMLDYLLTDPHGEEEAIPCNAPVIYNSLIYDDSGVWLPLNDVDTSARLLLKGYICHIDGTEEGGLYEKAVRAKNHLRVVSNQSELSEWDFIGCDDDDECLDYQNDETITLNKHVVTDLLSTYKVLRRVTQEDNRIRFSPDEAGVHYLYNLNE